MKKINLTLAILIAFLTLTSCVTNKVPNKEKRARKKLAKVLKLKDAIINTYPELVDCTAIVVDRHTVNETFKPKVDTIYIDTLLQEYIGLNKALDHAYSALVNLQDKDSTNTATIDLTKSRISFLNILYLIIGIAIVLIGAIVVLDGQLIASVNFIIGGYYIKDSVSNLLNVKNQDSFF